MLEKLTGGVRPYLLLSLLAVMLYVPGLATVPPLDRDESRFVQATRQMLETGDFVRIQFQDEMRAKKPVGAYWAQAAAVKLFSTPEAITMWPYRLPSALAAWVAALLVFAFGRHLFGPLPALIGAALMSSSLMLLAEGHQAKTDALLLACVVAAQGALARFYLAGRRSEAAKSCSTTGGCGSSAAVPGGPGPGVALAFWLAQGIAVLIKGPIVPMVSLLTILTLVVLERRGAWLMTLRPITGFLVAAAVAGPWFAAVSQATGGAFVGEAVKGDLLPKLLGAQESHGGWPGTYLLLAGLTFWPGSLFLWPALVKAWATRTQPAVRFCLAWIVPSWLVFELVPTKLPHYVLPTYPALALLVGWCMVGTVGVFGHRAARAWYGVWALIGLVLAATVVVAPIKFGDGFSAFSLPGAVGIAGASLLAAWMAWRGRLLPASAAVVATAAIAFPVVFDGVLPSLDKLWLSRGVAQAATQIGHTAPVAAAGFSEPSLVFLLGTRTVLTSGDGAAAHLVAAPGSLAVVSDREEPSFLDRAKRLGFAPQPLAIVKGLNYSRGKPIMLTVYAKVREP